MSDITNLVVDEVSTWYNDKSQGILFSWSANIGFGELTLYTQDGINWKADTECMCGGEDKDFIKMVLEKWIEQIEIAS